MADAVQRVAMGWWEESYATILLFLCFIPPFIITPTIGLNLCYLPPSFFF